MNINPPTPTKADEVYTRAKRAIGALAQLAFELADERPPELQDARDREAFDALDDVRQTSAELCALWDALWKKIGKDQPDPLPWSNDRYAALEPEDDTWLNRQKKSAPEEDEDEIECANPLAQMLRRPPGRAS